MTAVVTPEEETPLVDAPEDHPEGAEQEAAPESPYRNLMVPLVVVPAMIVIVLLVVFVLFGAISGSEATLVENLRTAVEGGANERTQAAFNLVRQVAEIQRAEAEGQESPWEIDEAFLPELHSAWERTPPEDGELRLVLATLMGHLGDPAGVPKLVTLLDLDEGDDEGAFVRFNTLANLGALGDERAVEGMVPFLDHEDEGLRSMTAIALQNMDDERSLDALRGALGDSSLEVRGNTAIALAVRGVPDGAHVLRDLIDEASYTAENERDESKYTRARQVSESRVQAVLALGRLKRPEDREFFTELAEQESDLAVKEAAMRVLESWQ